MPGEFKLRAAAPDDAATIARLSGQLGYPATASEIAARLKALSDESSHIISVAVAETGGVLGWIHVSTITHLEAGTFAEIAGLVVDEQHRGKGIGKALVRHAEEWAKSQACGSVVVRSNVLRTETHQFYKELGYPVIKQQMVFKKRI